MNRDPDERPRRDGDSEPGDEFDRIVSGWRREGAVPAWPDDDGAVEHRPEPVPIEAADDEHFVPPDPPPLPRLGPPALVGLVLLILGVVLVTTPSWVGLPAPYGLPLGLLALAAGLGWLVLRLWPTSADGDGEDDGAIL